MAYSTNDDLLKEFSTAELAKITGDPTGQQINEERIDNARKNADSTIDSYLYARYAVPFSAPVPDIIVKISVDLTVANLYDYSYRTGTVPATVTWRKITATKQLKDLQAGDMSLPGTNPGTDTVPLIISNKDENSKIFSEGILDKFYNGVEL